MAAYYIGYQSGNEVAASTMAFATLTMSRLFHGFNCRSALSIFHIGFSGNIYSLLAFLLGTLFLNLVLFVPFLQNIFSVADLTGSQIGMIYLLAFIPTVIIQIGKLVKQSANIK
jgi:Ca2+-transporting ATPase